MRIIDHAGVEKNWAWLVANYGPLVVHPAAAGNGWRVAEIVERVNAPAAILVSARNPDHTCACATSASTPAPGTLLAWYWPDAPYNAEAGPPNGVPDGMTPGRADRPGVANGEGLVGFAMGQGAYYWPSRGERGPHATWVYGQNSDVVFGLGMAAATNHNHLDVVFQREDEIEPPPPEPGDEWAALFALMDRIIALLERMTALLEATRRMSAMEKSE